MTIDGYTRLAAVLAKPIKHSLSPFIHNMAFTQTGLNAVYLAWEIDSEDLVASLANIKRYNMLGVNISMPYKETVIPLLDCLSDKATLIGAVNTVRVENDRLVGYNTDGQGFLRGLKALRGVDIADKRLVMLGSGSAARAILVEAALSGAAQMTVFTKSVYLASTHVFLERVAKQTGVQVNLYELTDLSHLTVAIETSDILVNGTSIGMDGVSSPLPESLQLPERLLVADVIYYPMETPLLAVAKRQGLQTMNGLPMLLYQAAEAFELWTGVEMPTSLIWQALQEKSYRKEETDDCDG